MRPRLLVGLMVILSLLLTMSCTRSIQPAPETEPVSESVRKMVIIDDIELSITTRKKKFKSNEMIPLRLRLLNMANTSTNLTYPTSQKYDFIAKDSDGQEAWRWSEGRVFAQAVVEDTMKLRERHDFFGKIEADVLDAGTYEISGLSTADELIGETVSIKVTIEK